METFTIEDLREVDDAGTVQFETRMTTGFILDAVENGFLRLENNIRFNGEEALKNYKKLPAKTRRKIDKWTEDLLAGDAVMGNLSVRLDPDTKHMVVKDGDGKTDLVIESKPDVAALDSAVDAQSRIMAMIRANLTQPKLFNRDLRCAVRVWVCDVEKAREIGARYNTEGENVNASSARSASPLTQADKLAAWLLRESGNRHLSTNNIEVLSNSVSATSHKLCGFYTLPLALTQEWSDLPQNDAQIRQMGQYISDCWYYLVTVRPEYALSSLASRQEYRKTSVAGAALGIYGAMAIIYSCYAEGLSVEDAKPYMDKLTGDWVLKSDPQWEKIGVLTKGVTKKGEDTLNTRNSFQSRQAVATAFEVQVGI